MRAIGILITIGIYIGVITFIGFKGAKMIKNFNDAMIRQAKDLEEYENS
jgi:hypothetical protein